MPTNSPFQEYSEKYDLWYERNPLLYASELECVKKVLRASGRKLEVGVGTGRFAAPLKVGWGIDPAPAMLARARARGVKVIQARGEELPFPADVFDSVLMVVTLCFVKEPRSLLAEAERILVPGGRIVAGIVDRNSFLGKMYRARKSGSEFYRAAEFYSVTEVLEMLPDEKWNEVKIFQTLFDLPGKIKQVQSPRPGYGEGGFVVISARKLENRKRILPDRGILFHDKRKRGEDTE